MFLGQTEQEEDAAIAEAIKSFEDRVVKLKEVKEFKDKLYEENTHTPIKIIAMGVGISWAIYHFLIKR